ncbi:hypothetical protein RB195_021482 [Necator americanus]|uniref:Protein kinase domain-containing protein n=1 Tax=Necator americanus TaxID=51031 RepID=A0ABR1EB84_NECAM
MVVSQRWVADADAYLDRPPQKFTIDEEETKDALVAVHALTEKDAVMQNRVLRVLFAAFLDVFCESVPNNIRDYVKSELSLMLVKMNVVPGLVFSEEFLSVRRTFAGIVSTVIKNCFTSDPNVDARLSIEKCTILSSRYRIDFEEIERIGSGGFGTVWKVKCLVDRCYYAIKKIPLKSNNTALTVKLLNEVHLLASLQHDNIVRYHTGWIEILREMVGPSAPTATQSSSSVVITEVDDDVAEDVNSTEPSNSTTTVTTENSESATATTITLSSSDNSSSTTGPGRFWARGEHDQASSPQFSDEAIGSDGDSYHTAIKPYEKSAKTVKIVRPTQANVQRIWHTEIYIQMELCTSNLEKHLKKRNSKIKEIGLDELSIDGAFNRELATQMLSAIEFIHQKNVIHRDIKPSNIFLKHQGERIRFLLGDFGLACAHNEDGTVSKSSGTKSDTLSGVIGHTSGTGTKTYAAPEQLKSNVYGPAVDIFAAGMVLLEAYHVFYTSMEKIEAFDVVRNRKCKKELLERFPILAKNWSSVASRVFKMTHSDPSKRPTASQLVQEYLHVEAKTVDDLKAIIRNQTAQLAAAHKLIQELRELQRSRDEK